MDELKKALPWLITLMIVVGTFLVLVLTGHDGAAAGFVVVALIVGGVVTFLVN